jgi:coenzyme F420-0:L-glutamate ligase / coenzyme F420-1:gamma-L-glutamate ligase
VSVPPGPDGASPLSLLPLVGLPEVQAGDDLGSMICQRIDLEEGDVVVVAQKAVSKSENRVLRLSGVTPNPEAERIAAKLGRDPRLVQVILDESREILRLEPVLIVETKQGFVCANAGVDLSNVGSNDVVLLPEDCDRSAASIQRRIRQLTGCEVGVVVADTFGRAWRTGIVNVALGVAGLAPLVDHRGRPDDDGRVMQATVIAVADELASAAELVMGKTRRVPATVIRGYCDPGPSGTGRCLLRAQEQDLFR